MLELRAVGTYPSRILAEAQALLDQEETRLQRRPGGAH
jgi:CPA1 family monovalent cation:H+ antiporter